MVSRHHEQALTMTKLLRPLAISTSLGVSHTPIYFDNYNFPNFWIKNVVMKDEWFFLKSWRRWFYPCLISPGYYSLETSYATWDKWNKSWISVQATISKPNRTTCNAFQETSPVSGTHSILIHLVQTVLSWTVPLPQNQEGFSKEKGKPNSIWAAFAFEDNFEKNGFSAVK